MLSQTDFVNMLTDMHTHMDKAVRILDELVSDIDDKDLRYRLVALRQTKRSHMEALAALTSVIKRNALGIKE